MAIVYLSGNPSKLTKQKANIVVDLLKAYNRENFKLLELEVLLDVKYHEKSTKLRVLLEGGDCGCCGNYLGHCWMTSIYCWEHDMLYQSSNPAGFASPAVNLHDVNNEKTIAFSLVNCRFITVRNCGI